MSRAPTVNHPIANKTGGHTIQQSGQNKRLRLLEAAMKRHQYRPDALIEVLHTTQELFGHLDIDLLLQVAHSLRLPPSRRLWGGDVLSLFLFRTEGNSFLYRLYGNRLLCQRRDATAQHPRTGDRHSIWKDHP